MPSNVWTDEQLRFLLIARSERLAELIKIRAPAEIIKNEIAMIVTAGRLYIGRECIDNTIANHQKCIDAKENGICEMCFKNPEIPGEGVCASCMSECENKSTEETLTLLDLFDDEIPGKIQ